MQGMQGMQGQFLVPPEKKYLNRNGCRGFQNPCATSASPASPLKKALEIPEKIQSVAIAGFSGTPISAYALAGY